LVACHAWRRWRWLTLAASADGRALVQVGELDGDGRIATMWTFVEPLAALDPREVVRPVERAVRTYVDVWSERDPAARRQLLAACLARDARLVGRIAVLVAFHGRLRDAD
jgi:hypothetical protein